MTKLEWSHTSNLTEKLKALEQKEASITKGSRQQEMIKLRAEINKSRNNKAIQRNSWFNKKTKKVDESLCKLTKSQREHSN